MNYKVKIREHKCYHHFQAEINLAEMFEIDCNKQKLPVAILFELFEIVVISVCFVVNIVTFVNHLVRH
jgi:hypothetical protein